MPEIRDLQRGDARAVAQLHAESINRGFLAKLGRRFLAELYLGIASDPGSRVFVAVQGERVLGFCAYTRNVAGLYRRVLKSRWLRLGWASLPASLNPRLVWEAFDTLRYPAKQRAQQLTPVEILSIAVAADLRGGGVGRKLLDEALQTAIRDGETSIKVLAGCELEGANRFYRSCGFDRVAEITQHGEALNVYVRGLDQSHPPPAGLEETRE